MKAHLGPMGTCHLCGKQCYLTRKAAKDVAKKKYPAHTMSVYACGDYWHYGHTPEGVTRGWTDRQTIKGKRRYGSQPPPG